MGKAVCRRRHVALVASALMSALPWVAPTAAGASPAPSAFAPGHAETGHADLCVGPDHGCHPSLRAALAAARSGDVIRVQPGTYRGGITIDKSVTIIGAGAGRSEIRGGGPVLTVGRFGAATEPTVALSGMTITAGITHRSFLNDHIAVGGGILIPPAEGFTVGGTLRIDRAVVSGNDVSPATGSDAGISCGTHDCEFGLAAGGGIDSWGRLRITRSSVLDNTVGGTFASDADGAGIDVHEGSLAVDHSRVADNRATTTAPDGRFAEGGGIMADSTFSGPGRAHCCTVAISSSEVSSNRADMNGNVPIHGATGSVIDTNANGGGIHIGDGIPTTITDTAVTGNDVRAADPGGEPYGIDAGVNVGDSPLTMAHSSVSHNRVETIAATSVDAGPGGSALELDGGGTISDSAVRDNVAIARSPAGAAQENGGLAVLNFTDDPRLVTLRRDVISGNVTQAWSRTATATVQGGAIFNNSLLAVVGSRISDNVATARAPHGRAQGGGIWNGVELSGPPVTLSLRDSAVTGNTLLGNQGIVRQGGGVYTTTPITVTTTPIRHNAPDQCVGC